jgi:nucleoside-diphosphate-sugar epimerase
MHVFLTGTTGYVGSAIAVALQRDGHTVTGLAHTDEGAQTLEQRDIRVLRGDLYDGAALARGVRATEGTIHAANTGGLDMPLAEQAAVSAMLGALEGTHKTFLYTQGIWDYGDTGPSLANEESPFQPAAFFAWRPVLAQRILDARRRGIRSIVISPALVYGHGRGIPAMLAQSARQNGAARYIGAGENHWTLVHVDDLADLYGRALTEALDGSTFIAASNPPLRVRELAAAASRGAGAGGKTEAWPLPAARRALGPWVDALMFDQQMSGEKARHVLGWTPQAPLALEDIERGSYAR